jgi:hypothetical protein
MTDCKEQRVCIKFSFTPEKNATEIFVSGKAAFKGQPMGITQVF